MAKFVKETNGGKTYKRFICEVQEQETEQETQEIADMLLAALAGFKIS